MAAPIALREDFDGPGLRRLAKQTKDAAQARRLLALAEIYNGSSRTDAARIGSVTLQIVRDWVLRFNKHGPKGLINGKASGNRPKLNDEQRQALARMVESGPIPAIHGVVRWRRKDLARWLFEEFRIEVDETTVGRALRAMGFAKLSARPRHYAQNEREMEAFKKACHHSGSDPSRAAGWHRDRAVVARRGQDRAEEQDHPPLGPTRHTALSAARPTDRLGLHLRGDLPGPGQGCWSRSALLRHGGHGGPVAGDQPSCGARRARGAAAGPSRLACLAQAPRAGQHHAPALAASLAGVEPGRERLAVRSRQLAVEPGLRILRQHRRPLL